MSRKKMTEAEKAELEKFHKQQELFNKYMGRKQEPNKAKAEALAKVELQLKDGEKERVVPKFENGARVGTEKKMIPLSPFDRAKLLMQREELLKSQGMTSAKREAMRGEFLAMLPEFAAKAGFSAEVLRKIGVEDDDLEQAGFKPVGCRGASSASAP